MDFIDAVKYFLLGVIQGITEVLPISSSGHVEIFKAILNVEIDEKKALIFLILVNTGSLLTFILIYFKRLFVLIRDFFIYIFHEEKRTETHQNFIYMSKILIACIPAGIFGLIFEGGINTLLADYGFLVVGIGLLLTSTVLILVSQERFHNREYSVTWLDTILIGTAQAVAIIPGVSRSGMTTSMALKRGSGVDSALNFSFLLYIPISFASLFLMIYKLFRDGASVPGSQYYFYYLLAFVGAMGATYIAYKLIFNIFKSGKLKYFGYYCLVIGLGSIIWYIAS